MNKVKCSGCKRAKAISEFFVDRSRARGLTSRCKNCLSEAKEQRRCKRCLKTKPYTTQSYYKNDNVCKACRKLANEKHCSICDKTKPFEAFYYSRGVYTSICRRCHDKCHSKNHAERRMLREFGLTPDVHRETLKNQNNRCAICKKKETVKLFGKVKALHVDHCHRTNGFRGLLCSECNMGLGKFKDNPDLLRIAAAYLEAYSAKG